MTSVAIGYVHDNADLSHSWHASIQDLIGWHLAADDSTPQLAGQYVMRYGTDGLPGARNRVVQAFLAGDAEWLFWIDCDMGFAPDTAAMLVAAADPDERPIVGALCFAQKEVRPDGMGGWVTQPRPTIYDFVQTTDGRRGFVGRRDYPRDALLRCNATGSACLVVHRRVFEAIGGGWYDKAIVDGTVQAEDLSFCMRAAAAGFPVHVDTSIKTTHLKHTWVDERQYLEQSWPDPATDPVAVIVPALRRPDSVEPFMASLRASTGLADAYWICDPDDHEQIAAVEKWGGTVVLNTTGNPSFAAKANVGYAATSEPWLLLVGDDVRFRPGWYDRALRAAGDRFHLVATNDQVNGAVMAGMHATHPLIRRRWIDEHGASWDGPGHVAHLGYRHGYVDSEWSAVAMQAGAFTFAPDAVIEHLHPDAGTGPDDEVYAIARAARPDDERLWLARAAEHLTPGGG